MNLIWGIFFALIAVLLALDLFVFHRKAHAISLREAVGWSIFWIALGVAFSAVVYGIYEHHWMGAGDVPGGERHDIGGPQAAALYLTAYVLEKALSVDNIFVIAMVFISFDVNPAHRHRILYWGILGAIVARCIMIGGGIQLVENITWIFYVFGGFLVLTGVRMMLPEREKEESDVEEPRASLVVRMARRILPISMDDHGGKLITRERGRIVFTRLALALISVEAADVMFAVDSVPAVLGVSTDPFIVITSNIFAILGLRSLYFVLESMMDRFRYLKVALSILLVVIGTKMCLHDVIHFHELVSLAVVVGIVGVGIAASLILDDGSRPDETSSDEPAAQPPEHRQEKVG